MEISNDRVALIHYHLTNADGDVIDSSRGREPLAYLHGHNNLVPGVESALVGKSAGDKLQAVVPPDQGYGERDPALDGAFPLEAFPENVREQLQPGVTFSAAHPQEPNQPVRFTVVGIEDDRVLASGNHPLAGVELHFDLEVVEVREASQEELTHGHVHGPGGHHH